MDISEYLKGRIYPGRILSLGKTTDGKPYVLYIITARSEKSRDRILVKNEEGLFTKSLSDSDDHLLLYKATEKLSDGSELIGNGDHVTFIKEKLDKGNTLEEAISVIFPEDDTYFTPRIFACLDSDGSYSIGIVRGQNENTERILWKYGESGNYGRLISTYKGISDEVEQFDNNPVLVEFDGDIERIWASIGSNITVALYCKIGKEEKIINGREQ